MHLRGSSFRKNFLHGKHAVHVTWPTGIARWSGLMPSWTTDAKQHPVLNWDLCTFSGVYVKVVLIGNGKVVQKKKTRIIHQAMKQPVFDETFTFSLPAGLANQSCLIVSVCGKTANNKRQHIGYVSLGPPFFATGSGLEQWTKMLSSPFTTVGKWHSLSVWSKNDSSQHLVNECNVFWFTYQRRKQL